MHSINKNASSLATDAMAFGLPIRWRRITHGSAASWDVFLHTQNQLYNLPLQNLYRRHMHKRHVLFKLEQNTRRKKKLSLNRVFHKLDNNKWKMYTGARARKQKYISIYISLYMKTFLKTFCCSNSYIIYIYIYIYISVSYTHLTLPTKRIV